MKDLVRDSFIGQLVNRASGGRLLPYADQRSDYVIPERYLAKAKSDPHISNDSLAVPHPGFVHDPHISNDSLAVPHPGFVHDPQFSSDTLAATPMDAEINIIVHDPTLGNTTLEMIDIDLRNIEKVRAKDLESGTIAAPSPEIADPYLVDWDGPNDQDNPKNWSPFKKGFVAFSISLLTFSIYIGSAIYTMSEIGIVKEFKVPEVKASLGLTLYILAYGIGPMFLTPLQEMASYGRNPVYIIGLAIFIIFNVPIVVSHNFSVVLAFRFFTGFIGSPALATGGASMADIFPGSQLPYVIGIWALGAVGGPILGPVIGGFAAQAESWRWPIYELIWISGFALLFLAFLLPETLEANILLKRAQRLRKLTGNPNLRSQSEIDEAKMNHKEFIYESLVRPFVLAAEPAVLFLNLYLGLVYSVFYLWFEAFPLVFVDIYHFNLGLSGLPYIAFVVSGTITYTIYCLYLRYHLEPRFMKEGSLAPEARLEIGLMASVFIPISLFMFGWSARESVHWIVPVIAAALYLPGIFLTFQSILMYLSISYSKYTGSVLASNDLFRSSMASVFPLFGSAFFRNLGLGPGSSLLAGISILMMPIYFLLIRYGDKLRARSRYAA